MFTYYKSKRFGGFTRLPELVRSAESSKRTVFFGCWFWLLGVPGSTVVCVWCSDSFGTGLSSCWCKPAWLSDVSRMWRRFRLNMLPLGDCTLYDRGSGHSDTTFAGCQTPVVVSCTRTSYPGISRAKSVAPLRSWLMHCEVCRSVRRWPISSFRQCSFLIFTGTFVLNLRAFNISAGDGRWLSTGVALSTSSAICRSD